MTTAVKSVQEPRVISRRSPNGEAVNIHSAIFCWNVRTLDRISSEFGVDRSNEKAVTLLRGFQKHANAGVAAKLIGRRFLLDMRGRELPTCLGTFSKDTLDVVDQYVPDGDNEPFVADLIGQAREAVKFKLLLKNILMYSRLLYTNESDNAILTFEVISEPKGEGVLQAAFCGCSSDEDMWCSITEITDFKMEDV